MILILGNPNGIIHILNIPVSKLLEVMTFFLFPHYFFKHYTYIKILFFQLCVANINVSRSSSNF